MFGFPLSSDAKVFQSRLLLEVTLSGLKCSSAKHWPQPFAVVVGIVGKKRIKEKERIILHSATTKMNNLHLTCHQNVGLEVPGCSSAGYEYL